MTSTSWHNFANADMPSVIDHHATEEVSTNLGDDDSNNRCNSFRHHTKRHFILGLVVLGALCFALGVVLRGPARTKLQGLRVSQSTILTEPIENKDCLFVSMGPGTLCKSSKDDLSLDGNGTAKVHAIGPQGRCQKFCLEDDTCTGYEYRAIEERCEIWHIPIRYARKAVHPFEFECKAKHCNHDS
mmetsp:Transcript_119037/g.237344  ORF Transcript_119037/g.237344 Transcript_119037/m.237344 type:complete len:186 (+) Transcript_119037:79-636(+)|eukprot:CAMPEP_0172675712 /NCGR_PEP_ID=MMETSP1074-20121228/13444_1 /TAXON_ID=2916 /ORGANISM="Ceratium fusus, Strain PA161109" /LENGTH=185 /DNA_ID=CAMNT_0013493207 /DNA_START=77 /DNA_END=634 /DNA_ORIENTATION=-